MISRNAALVCLESLSVPAGTVRGRLLDVAGLSPRSTGAEPVYECAAFDVC